MDDLDAQIRMQTSRLLGELLQSYGKALPRELLAVGFEFDGKPVLLVEPQRIFKPAILPEIPISITTAQSLCVFCQHKDR